MTDKINAADLDCECGEPALVVDRADWGPHFIRCMSCQKRGPYMNSIAGAWAQWATPLPDFVAAMDWSWFKDQPITSTCQCSCGAEFRSHTKFNMTMRRGIPLSPCPGCGKHDGLRGTRSDPEHFVIKG
jgi:hypothetical protein